MTGHLHLDDDHDDDHHHEDDHEDDVNRTNSFMPILALRSSSAFRKKLHHSFKSIAINILIIKCQSDFFPFGRNEEFNYRTVSRSSKGQCGDTYISSAGD